jgi:hypothetical protein
VCVSGWVVESMWCVFVTVAGSVTVGGVCERECLGQ